MYAVSIVLSQTIILLYAELAHQAVVDIHLAALAAARLQAQAVRPRALVVRLRAALVVPPPDQ